MIDFRFICQVSVLLAIILISGCKSEGSKTAPVDTQGNLFTLLSSKETGIQFANNIRQNVDEHIFNFNYILMVLLMNLWSCQDQLMKLLIN